MNPALSQNISASEIDSAGSRRGDSAVGLPFYHPTTLRHQEEKQRVRHAEHRAFLGLVKQLNSADETRERRANFKRMLKTSPQFGRNNRREKHLLSA